MKLLGIIITGICTSLYLFPFQLTGLPGNTKLFLAMGGLIVLGAELGRGMKAELSSRMLQLSIFAIGVSICAFLSVTVNNTPDFAYAGYIVSMWVWISAAYFVLKLIQGVHGHVNIWIIANYLIVVCVGQCIAAILIDRFDSVKSFVDTYVQQGQDFLNNTVGVKRKYGIGANLDVAGSRFSAVLVILAFVLSRAQKERHDKWIPFYVLAFFLIAAEGNVIARTTTVGVLLSIMYWILRIGSLRVSGPNLNRKAISMFSAVAIIAVMLCIYLYNADEKFMEDMRFGFEGFFSLVEKGSWDVSSNDRLSTMYVWPESTKTWLIGDGYFASPRDTDPFFIGEIVGGYYMGTDVGFLRFIFYFGLLGLCAFSVFFIKCTEICCSAFKEYRIMFFGLLMVNFIVWLKVATDIFVVFAPFVALSAMNQMDNNRQPAAS